MWRLIAQKAVSALPKLAGELIDSHAVTEPRRTMTQELRECMFVRNDGTPYKGGQDYAKYALNTMARACGTRNMGVTITPCMPHEASAHIAHSTAPLQRMTHLQVLVAAEAAQLGCSMAGSIPHSRAAALQVLHCGGQNRPQQPPPLSQTRSQAGSKGAHEAQEGTDKGCMGSQLLHSGLGTGCLGCLRVLYTSRAREGRAFLCVHLCSKSVKLRLRPHLLD